MKKLLLLLLAPLLLVSCSSDDDDLENEDGVLTTKSGNTYLYSYTEDGYAYVSFISFTTDGFIDGEAYADNSWCDTVYYPWNVEKLDGYGGKDKYQVTKNTSDTLEVTHTFWENSETTDPSGEVKFTVKFSDNTATIKGFSGGDRVYYIVVDSEVPC